MRPTLLPLLSGKRTSSDTSVETSGAHGVESPQEAPVVADDEEERFS